MFSPIRAALAAAAAIAVTSLLTAQIAKTTYSVGKPKGSLYNELSATENGKTYKLIPESKNQCLEVVEQKDFDGNGTLDALVQNTTACGGNCCPNGFFFISARGGGKFDIGDPMADSWVDPVIERWKGRWSVVIVSNNAGVNTERPVEITRRFVFENGKAVKVEERQRKEIQSLLDLRSEVFKSGSPDERHQITYDLDGDGRQDKIGGTLWERWGLIVWTVEFANGKKAEGKPDCKRIGVLASKTSGVHDLVCDQDTVLRWDGKRYH
jgi:hypothetical protein